MNAEGVVTRSVRDTAGAASTRSRLPARDRCCHRSASPARRCASDCGRKRSTAARSTRRTPLAAEHCASLLEGLGCSVEISSPSPLSDPAFWKAAATVLAVNVAVEVDTWSAKLGRRARRGRSRSSNLADGVRRSRRHRGRVAGRAEPVARAHRAGRDVVGSLRPAGHPDHRRTPRPRSASTPRATSRAAAAPSPVRSTSPVNRRSACRSAGPPTACRAASR